MGCILMMDKILIHEIYLSEGHDFKGRFGKERLRHAIRSVPNAEAVEGKGLVGDRYFGYKDNFKGQLTLISEECIQEVEQELGLEPVDRSAFRRNVVVSGVDLNDLVGKGFRIGGLELYGTEQCKPCFWMDGAIAEGACDALGNRGGLRCRIESDGMLRKGENDFECFETE